MDNIKTFNMDMPVHILLHIPARIQTVCRVHNIRTISELAEKPASFWMMNRNIGKKYTQMLYDTLLNRYGIEMQGAVSMGLVTSSSDRDVQNIAAIPPRVKTICRRNGIATIDEIAMMRRSQWLNMRNMGEKNVSMLENALSKFGLSFSSEYC